ncbi:hypothetical protein H257_10251 [Aphanomyces astaci]|uniref:Uncharacterized protein n=1 Tax=Aphanomyces astaci TaxID=112090 RepID=W4G6U9_APHAT|nr:hypothetical protein H257_10251 [Aphanomyces astaci]ETV75400.1 hypothetical protein H257_10251 [Aphanomyces astaci]RQM29445.1 hypothetical protein B5M09_010214 [Aphanomyces astaci]|eukprot:XP_009835034.1 hypothetical protein H257_10251 [Aphanomyces astaci]
MTTILFRNQLIAIHAWKLQKDSPSGGLLDVTPSSTLDGTTTSALLSFWLRDNPPSSGQFLRRSLSADHQSIDHLATWLRGLYCEFFGSPPICRHKPDDEGALQWSSNVGTTLLYEDDLVKVWDFHVAPQARCHYHVHRHTYMFINLMAGITQPVDEHGHILVDKPVREHAQGEITFVDVPSLPTLPHHAFKNVSTTTPFCQYIIEFKESNGSS